MILSVLLKRKKNYILRIVVINSSCHPYRLLASDLPWAIPTVGPRLDSYKYTDEPHPQEALFCVYIYIYMFFLKKKRPLNDPYSLHLAILLST